MSEAAAQYIDTPNTKVRPTLILDFNFDDLDDIQPEGKPITIVANGVLYEGDAKLQGNMITLHAEHGVIVLRTNRKQLEHLQRLEQQRVIPEAAS